MTDNRPFRDKPLTARRAIFMPWRLPRRKLEEILSRQNVDLARLDPRDELKLADLEALREVIEMSLEFRVTFGDKDGRDIEMLHVHMAHEGRGILDAAIANERPSVMRLLASDPVDDDFNRAQARAAFLEAQARVRQNPLPPRPRRLSSGGSVYGSRPRSVSTSDT